MATLQTTSATAAELEAPLEPEVETESQPEVVPKTKPVAAPKAPVVAMVELEIRLEQLAGAKTQQDPEAQSSMLSEAIWAL